MRKHFWWITCFLLLFSVTIISWRPVSGRNSNPANLSAAPSSSKAIFAKYVDEIYQAAQLQQTGLGEDVFKKAITGFINLKIANKIAGNSSIITIVDFDKPSREKRMWIVDLLARHLLINTWVAHGEGSGAGMASSFSNTDDSHQSSLGFFLADDIYIGKHGRSLHLDGLDEGFNTAARAREIVVHAAPYVSESTIAHLGYLGRSWGCPAVSPKIANEVINTIQGKTVFFINNSSSNYTSKYLDEDMSANYVSSADTSANTFAQL